MILDLENDFNGKINALVPVSYLLPFSFSRQLKK